MQLRGRKPYFCNCSDVGRRSRASQTRASERESSESRCPRSADFASRSALRLREIQLHADAVGIVEEELRIAGARHNALAEFHVPGLQTLAHAVGIGRGKGNVVEAASVLIFLLGATPHDSCP